MNESAVLEKLIATEAEITRLMPLAYDTSGMAWRLRAEGHQQAALDALAEVARLQERQSDRIVALEAQVKVKDEALLAAEQALVWVEERPPDLRVTYEPMQRMESGLAQVRAALATTPARDKEGES